VGSSEWTWLNDDNGAFIAAMHPQTALTLIGMARTAYARALHDVKNAMQIAALAGANPSCGFGCDAHAGGLHISPGCPIHDPTAPIGTGGFTMGSAT
jgi:hypothetical protein